MTKYILLFASLFAMFIQSNAAISYVTTSGAGLADGTSWANAFAGSSLQSAISASGTGDEVWVAAGTYLTTSTTTRTISFSMRNDVTIYGSFVGTETTVSQRALTNGLTSILSGEIGSAGNSDNSYHVISNSGLDNSAIIDGFIISNGNDSRTISASNGLGGGVYNNGSGSGNECNPTIRNCIIMDNEAGFGAGIFNNGYNGGTSSPIISNCIISENTATDGGGGIDNFGLAGTASPTITNCVIYNNSASGRAGGMFCWGANNGNASPVVLNTVFVNNTATDGGGVVASRLNISGGGSSGTSNPSFRNCIFWGNTASGTGPQFLNLGSATFTATYSDINLTGQSSPHVISGSGTGNLNTNPLFSNISTGAGTDGDWMTSDDGLILQSTSTCIDAGENTGVSAADILTNNRIHNSTVDMGAYEYGASALPVELLWFSANCDLQNIVLNWSTASETNNDFFTIENSFDGTNWVDIVTIGGAGNSSQINNYSYTHELPTFKNRYYRLKQTDYDGKTEYSKIVVSKYCMNNIQGLSIYPNPATDFVNIKYNNNSSESVFISLCEINGSLIKTQDVSQIDEGQLTLNLTNLQPGIYLLTIRSTNENYTKKIIKID